MLDLEQYITELLHTDELHKNKLMDLFCSEYATYLLFREGEENTVSARVLTSVKALYTDAKEQMTALRGSALQQVSGGNTDYENTFDWRRTDHTASPVELNAFIEKIYREDLGAKGNNPLFLSIGAVKWSIAENGTADSATLTTPLLIIPIRLVRMGTHAPVLIKYIEDDIYINPCLYHSLKKRFGENVTEIFPLPEGCSGIDTPVDIVRFEADAYFARVYEFFASLGVRLETEEFVFDPHLVAISTYRHSDYCMYYDIRRNMARIRESKLVERVFSTTPKEEPSATKTTPTLVLPYDKTQQDLISRVVAGDSLVVQGPPGSGKTHTIANMIAALMAENKRVLFVSTKTPALAEVYKKMPEELTPYLLPLYAEGEQNAASTGEVTAFHDSLRRAYEAESNDLNASERDKTLRVRKAALEHLSRHYAGLFHDSALLGRSVYQILCDYMQDPDITPVPFLTKQELAGLNWQSFNNAEVVVERAADAFDLVTEHGKRPFRDCAWSDMSGDKLNFNEIDDTFGDTAEELAGACNDILTRMDNDPLLSELSMNTLSWLANARMSDDSIRAILSDPDFKAHYEYLSESFRTYHAARPAVEAAEAVGANVSYAEPITLSPLYPKENMPASLLCMVAPHRLTRELTAPTAYPFAEAVIQAAHDYEICNREIAQARGLFLLSFSENCLDGIEKNKAFLAAQKEISKCRRRGRTDALSAKTVAKLAQLSHRANPTHDEICRAVAGLMELQSALPRAQSILDGINLKLASNAIALKLTPDDFKWLQTMQYVADHAKLPSLAEVLRVASSTWRILSPILDTLKLGDTSLITTDSLRTVVDGANAHVALRMATETIQNAIGVTEEASPTVFISGYLALYETYAALQSGMIDGEDPLPRLTALMTAAREAEEKHGFTALCRSLWSFLEENYPEDSYHRSLCRSMRLVDFPAFAHDLDDRAAFEAVHLYRGYIDSVKEIDLARFFAIFEDGVQYDAVAKPLAAVFRHSILSQVLQTGLRPDTELLRVLQTAAEAEDTMLKQNAAVISHACRASIVKSSAYDFLTTKCKYRYLRTYFKEKSREILTLKRCLIMSPSAVSVLLRTEPYMDFDVVILDEASQIPPAYALPVLIRAKQCVMVGDIYQMPYIRNFSARRSSSLESMADEYERVDSILDLVNQNESFPSTMLSCHFRSRTESLIAYSQRRYYRNMLTFPSPDPLGDDKGFRDILVDGATIRRGGVATAANQVEADEVIKCLTAHFERYFDPASKTLTRSIGVIAFGEKQVRLIEEMIEKSSVLAPAVRHIRQIGDVGAERYFFVKAIQKAQGMETDDLILSMTYGRIHDLDRDTKTPNSHWGDLNRDFGEKIFNVAVTRARMSVTVIHSVPFEELGDSLGYIREYLSMLHDFVSVQQKTGGFISHGAANPFVSQLAKALVSLGIPEDRIVPGYGVSGASYVIPLAILSPDKTRADAGILCEVPVPPGRSYIDHMVRYPHILESRGWKTEESSRLIRVFITDYFINPERVTNELRDALTQLKVL